jgi:hypothetical protein
MDPKTKRTEKSISRPVRSMDGRKANPTTIIDAATALKAELAGLAAEKKQKGKSGNAAFFAKGAGSKPKSRLGLNRDGDLIIRKASTTTVGEKRKRGKVLETPNKRSVIEGRDFAPLRTRRWAPMSSAMELDPVPVPASLVTL